QVAKRRDRLGLDRSTCLRDATRELEDARAFLLRVEAEPAQFRMDGAQRTGDDVLVRGGLRRYSVEGISDRATCSRQSGEFTLRVAGAGRQMVERCRELRELALQVIDRVAG